jgi:hypothetical protein
MSAPTRPLPSEPGLDTATAETVAMPMKTVSVSLAKIKPNPFRDLDLFPVDDEHVAALVGSVDRHGFFGGIKARKVDGFYEAGCGVHRLAAARKAGLKSVEIVVGEITDDEMINLMVTENGTQSGNNPAAAMNDVVAVTRRLIEGLMGGSGMIIPDPIKDAFDDKHAMETAQGKLHKRIGNPDAAIAIGHYTIRKYLGQGKPKDSPLGEIAIREALDTLKKSGVYDDIVDATLAKNAAALVPEDTPPATTKAISIKARTPRKRIIDERCASVFKNDQQFKAFKESLSTEAAKRFIPVDQQLKLAKMIVSNMGKGAEAHFSKKQVGAAFIKNYVTGVVREAAKQQADIDEEEKQRLYAEQRDVEIKSEVKSATNSYRSLTSALIKLTKLAEEFPGHRYLGDLAGKLGALATSIEAFRKVASK